MLSTFAKLPGSTFGWMVTANESQSYQQLSARNSSYLDNNMMEKNYSLPYFPKHTPEVAFLGQSASNLNIGQQDGVGGILNPIGTPYLKDSQYALSRDKPFDAPQKRFLIFDQSGNDTRLFFSPAFSHQDRTPARLDHAFLMKPRVEEKWDENHLSDGEMLEDSEEINALLYSDSEYDEVSSTRHGDDELWDQVGSSDDSPKRQRLLDGKYNKSSLESGGSSSSYANDVQSSCDSNNKAKIRKALKILETIIPGLDNNDPLSVIDQAVAYLKSMKTEAEELSCTGCCNSESLQQ
ncbi:hypothetical protein ACS0TY_001989 [Phlomoides rotata]